MALKNMIGSANISQCDSLIQILFCNKINDRHYKVIVLGLIELCVLWPAFKSEEHLHINVCSIAFFAPLFLLLMLKIAS